MLEIMKNNGLKMGDTFLVRSILDKYVPKKEKHVFKFDMHMGSLRLMTQTEKGGWKPAYGAAPRLLLEGKNWAERIYKEES